jgi:hypothetical protein
MQEQSGRFANVLSRLGIEKDQVLCSFSYRLPIRSRMEIGKARVLLTSTKNYQKNLGHQLD